MGDGPRRGRSPAIVAAVALGLLVGAARSTAESEVSPDPLIPFSTLLGGSGWEFESVVAVAPDGTVWVAAESDSDDFPLAPRSRRKRPKGHDFIEDIIVTRFDPETRAVLSATRLGGGAYPRALAFDASGNAFLAGTAYGHWPLATAPFSTPSARPYANYDVFVARIPPTGAGVDWIGIVGGRDEERVSGLAVTAGGDPVVVGWTHSVDFPLVAPLQESFLGNYGGFALRIRGDGSSIAFSTFLGENATGVAALPGGGFVVTGESEPPGFPGAMPLEGLPAGPYCFLAELEEDGTAVRRAAAAAIPTPGGVLIDSANRLVFWGTAYSPDYLGPDPGFPVVGTGDTWVLRVDATDWSVLGAGFAPGIVPQAASAAPDGTVWMAGVANGSLPVAGSSTPFRGRGSDGAVLAFSGADLSVVHGTYLGGVYDDRAESIATAPDGTAWCAGTTYGGDFPLVEPIQAGRGMEFAPTDAFLAQLLAGDPAGRPAAPASAAAEVTEEGFVRLTWGDSSSNESGFALLRRERNRMNPSVFEFDGFRRVGVAPAGATEWIDETVVSDRRYDWAVQAFNAAGSSAPTDPVALVLPSTLAATVREGSYRLPGRRVGRIRLRGSLSLESSPTTPPQDPREVGFEFAFVREGILGLVALERVSIPPDDPGWRTRGPRVRWTSPGLRFRFDTRDGSFEIEGPAGHQYLGIDRRVPLRFTLGRDSGSVVVEWVEVAPGRLVAF